MKTKTVQVFVFRPCHGRGSFMLSYLFERATKVMGVRLHVVGPLMARGILYYDSIPVLEFGSRTFLSALEWNERIAARFSPLRLQPGQALNVELCNDSEDDGRALLLFQVKP